MTFFSKPFGDKKKITVKDVEDFLESRCFPPNDVKEAAGHELWIKNKYVDLNLYKDATVYTVFITTANDIQDNTAIFGPNICYLTRGQLLTWAEKVIDVLKQVYRTFYGEGNVVWREDTIKSNR